MSLLDRRRAARQGIEVAEGLITRVDRDMRSANARGRAPEVPTLEPTEAQLDLNPQQAITLNVQWVGAALDHQRADGWAQCVGAFKALVDYANEGDGDWRNRFDDVVTDPRLRDILVTALDLI